MKNKNITVEVLRTLFALKPEADLLYITGDGNGWTEKERADAWSRHCKDDEKVYIFHRDTYEKLFEVKDKFAELAELAAKGTNEKPSATSEETENKTGAAGANETTASQESGLEADASTKETLSENNTPVKGASDVDSVRDAIVAKYTQLYGKAPFPGNMKDETLKAKIAEKEAEGVANN